MTNHRITTESGTLEVKGSPATKTVMRGAETWPFFAFVFAAVVTLALGLLDDMPWPWWAKAPGRVLAFVVLGYVLLRNIHVRNWLAGVVLKWFKEERD